MHRNQTDLRFLSTAVVLALTTLGGCIYNAPIGKDDASVRTDVAMGNDAGACVTQNVQCAPGKHCEELATPTQCLVPPCAVVTAPVCVDDARDAGSDASVHSCATDNVQCPPAQHCEDLSVQCLVPPCPAATPVCVPDGTDGGTQGCTSNAQCGAGRYCAITGTYARCEPYPTCASTLCAFGTRCEDHPIQCVTTPCPPTSPVCVPVATDAGVPTSCTNSRECPAGYTCTGGAGCNAVWTCQSTSCTADLVPYCTCDGRTVQGSSSCPPEKYATRGACSTPPPDAGTGSSCTFVRCAAGTYCTEYTGTTQCIPYPTCIATQCPAGRTCTDVAIQCLVPPCPPTVPYCQ